ncbi:MAG: ATP-binding protein [Sulfuricurvum sp.]
MRRGSIPADIASIVSDLKDISFEQIIFEAVTNSMHAKAKDIDINFYSNSLEVTEQKYIDKLIIIDNGEGFNDDNTESFQKYRSAYKRPLGSKGIGRFFYLKIFENVRIESLNKKINFVIDKDIDVSELENLEYDKTSVFFEKPKIQFTVDYSKLEQQLRDHFIAYFRLLDNEEVTIKIRQNDVKQVKIVSDEIPKFKSRKFKIRSHEFTIDYVFNDETINEYDGFYCAGGRVVIKNSALDNNKKLKAFKNLNILYLLSSDYFDTNVNDARDNFNIMPARTKQGSLTQNTSWKDIQDELSNQIKLIAKENDIDIDAISQKNLSDARKEAPFLINYLSENELAYATDTLISQAKRVLEDDKEFLRDEANQSKEDYPIKLGKVTQTELAEYIFDRQKIIEKLKSLTDANVIEQEIHNLFMKQRTDDDKQNYRKNNLWLFDDRFMTYDKVFSEAQLSKIFPQLPEIAKRPDILSIVSNTYNEEEITDIVIIELKRPDENIDPAGAETQLLRYSRYINDSREENKIRIWTYAFLKFNEETEFDLDNKNYNKIPTNGAYPIYYRYYEKPNTIINFIDYRSLAYDADTRNKTFMKILNGETLKQEDDNNGKSNI